MSGCTLESMCTLCSPLGFDCRDVEHDFLKKKEVLQVMTYSGESAWAWDCKQESDSPGCVSKTEIVWLSCLESNSGIFKGLIN